MLCKRQVGAKTIRALRIFLPRRPATPPPVDRPVPGTGTLPDAGGAGGGGHAPRIPPLKADYRKIYAY